MYRQMGGRKRPDGSEYISIDTSNILFICSGAFEGMQSADTDSLIKFGMMPELLGRLPIKAQLYDLTEDELFKVLYLPKNSIVDQYIKLFKIDGHNLGFSTEALLDIAQYANKHNLGARGLRSIMERVLLDIMFNLSDDNNKIFIQSEDVEKALNHAI